MLVCVFLYTAVWWDEVRRCVLDFKIGRGDVNTIACTYLLLLRETIVNRTYVAHKNLHI